VIQFNRVTKSFGGQRLFEDRIRFGQAVLNLSAQPANVSPIQIRRHDHYRHDREHQQRQANISHEDNRYAAHQQQT